VRATRPRGTGTALPLLLHGALSLLAIAPCAFADDAARTEVSRSGSVVQVRSTIEASAPGELCYAVLADFDRLAEFIPGMQSSRVVSPAGEPLLLRQIGQATVSFVQYGFDVTLAVTEDPPRKISFSRVAGNLRQMQGSWQVGGDAIRCRIDYRADIEPGFWVPPLIGPLLMRRQVEQQIVGLVAEIERRARGDPAP
jgi:carbon monoxide dehydrogenase subunit G